MNATVKTYSWLIRREFWERRAVWIMPTIIGIIVILIALFGKTQFVTLDSPLQTRAAGKAFLFFLSVLFYCFSLLSAALYLLDSLYEDRRDRSILFWKSLPISDTDMVLSKLLTGIIVIPLVSFAAADITALITSFIISVRARSMIGSSLWQGDIWLQVQVLWLYVIATAAIWYLPFVGWLMVVSAWVKRAPILWALMPFLVDFLIEQFFLGSHVLLHYLGRWMGGYPEAALRGQDMNITDSGEITKSLYHMINIGGFFTDPRTWIGAAVGAAFIFAAIQIRMRRTES
jgi:ABC-2 type transport system permease protein